jgi:hypothetical protein
LESLDDLLAQAASPVNATASTESVKAPANQDTPARAPKELHDLLEDGSELA